MASGTWIYAGNTPYITYSINVEYRNRTSNSVQIRVNFTNTLKANYYYGFDHYFSASFNGWNTANTGSVLIATGALWGGYVGYDRSNTKTTDWITVPLSTTNKTTVEFKCDFYGTDGTEGTITPTKIEIPAY